MLLLGGHMFVSFLHVMLPLLYFFHKWSNYGHNSKVILLRQLHLDNVGEFSSQTFIEYYVLVGINIDHPIAHTHTQNGLA